jgi:hypothetical protein
MLLTKAESSIADKNRLRRLCRPLGIIKKRKTPTQ